MQRNLFSQVKGFITKHDPTFARTKKIEVMRDEYEEKSTCKFQFTFNLQTLANTSEDLSSEQDSKEQYEQIETYFVKLPSSQKF